MAHEIFITYRRSDAQHAAFARHAHLARAFVFGEARVFLGRERFEAGCDGATGLTEAIGEARRTGCGWRSPPRSTVACR